MEIFKETKIITETREQKTYDLQCDCCKKIFTGDHSTYQGEIEWPDPDPLDSYHHVKTHVLIRSEDRYPDDYSWTSHSYHICPDCMKSVVFPFLQEKCGIPPHRNTEWDKDR